MSAETTAKTFFESVVVNYGVPKCLVTDRGAAFCSKFFATLAKLLGVKHRISSAKSPRTNGLAEQLVQRISSLLRTYASDDQSIETALPLCELCIRCTSHTKLKISPYEVVFGRKMQLGLPFDLSSNSPKLPGDQFAYFKWLQHRLEDVHKGVAENLKDTRQEMKTSYDRRHRVQEETWKVGQKVLLLDKRVNPGVTRVLTHQPYSGPFFITQCVQSDKIGMAYKLVHADTGRAVKSLVNGDRLKLYTADDRDKLIDRLPGLKKRSEVKLKREINQLKTRACLVLNLLSVFSGRKEQAQRSYI